MRPRTRVWRDDELDAMSPEEQTRLAWEQEVQQEYRDQCRQAFVDAYQDCRQFMSFKDVLRLLLRDAW